MTFRPTPMNSFNAGWTGNRPLLRSPQPWISAAQLNRLIRRPLETAYRALTAEIGLKAGQVFGTIRVAVTGRRVAPPLFDTMAAIGRDKCAARLENALSLLSNKVEA